MSATTIEKRGQKGLQQDVAASGPDAEAKYRQMVIAVATGKISEPAPTVLEAAARVPSDFRRDLKTYIQRLKTAENLRQVSELERTAEAAKAKLRTVADCGDRPLSDFGTLRELATAIQRYRNCNDINFVSQEKIDAHQAEMNARSARTGALQLLTSTADPAIEAEIEVVRRQIGNLNSAIANRQQLTNLESRIAEQTDLAEQLSQGKGLSRFQARNDFRRADVLAAEAKRTLRELLALRPAAEQALAENKKAGVEIGKLEERIAELAAKKLVPENMAWSE